MASTPNMLHRFSDSDLYSQMNALVAVPEVVQAADDRVCTNIRVTDLRDVVGNVMTAVSMAGVTLDDPRFVAGAFWYNLLQCEGAQAIGMLLRLQALADHPDACVAVVRNLAEKLEQGLFTDEALPANV